MIAKQAYLLIGNDRTGKTTLQKRIAKYLCGVDVERLNRNRVYQVTHKDAPEYFKTISLMNRSFQEKKDEYDTIRGFFENHFANADVVVLSSHLNANDITEMLLECRKRFYNTNLIVFENSLEEESELISKLATYPLWSKVIVLPNPLKDSEKEILNQLDNAAKILVEHIVKNSVIC